MKTVQPLSRLPSASLCLGCWLTCLFGRAFPFFFSPIFSLFLYQLVYATTVHRWVPTVCQAWLGGVRVKNGWGMFLKKKHKTKFLPRNPTKGVIYTLSLLAFCIIQAICAILLSEHWLSCGSVLLSGCWGVGHFIFLSFFPSNAKRWTWWSLRRFQL